MLKNLTKIGIKDKTDKAFWHKYTEFYDSYFEEIKNINPNPDILEFGVFRGGSIRSYSNFFESPTIYGLDWLPVQPEWPIGPKIRYIQVDQSDRNAIKKVLLDINKKYDLVVEDGGHRPDHQYNSLMESISYLKDGGLYILEDLQTSMKGHSLNKTFFNQIKYQTNCYQCLLLIKHIRQLHSAGLLNEADVNRKLMQFVKTKGLISLDDIMLLNKKIKDLFFYKRADLPILCYNCGGSDFDYIIQKCLCGSNLMDYIDSLSVVIRLV